MKMKKREKIYNFIKGPAKNFVVSVGIFLVLAPVRAYAQEVSDQKPPQTINEKAVAIAQTATGLSKVLDPSTTALQKVVFGSRACCLVSGLTFGYVASKSPIGSKVNKAATLCCVGSWNAYAALLFLNENKLTQKAPTLK